MARTFDGMDEKELQTEWDKATRALVVRDIKPGKSVTDHLLDYLQAIHKEVRMREVREARDRFDELMKQTTVRTLDQFR